MKIFAAQFNPRVGDIEANTSRILEIADAAEQQGADLVVFPELAICGYPPEDLLLRGSMALRIERALQKICEKAGSAAILVGYPALRQGKTFNQAGVFRQGKLLTEYSKRELPNYRVFDEKRYFTPGQQACVVDIAGTSVGLLICEDVWHVQPLADTVEAGAELVVVINASPYHRRKHQMREALLRSRAEQFQVPLLYLNMVGGQDELVFDGDTMLLEIDGEATVQAPWFQETSLCFDYDFGAGRVVEPAKSDCLDDEQAMYQALVLGVRDYVQKNGFPGALLGLSGGIDSALTLAIAVDALGSERVEAVMMPFRYTSDLSESAASEQAATQKVSYRIISIEDSFAALETALAPEFEGRSVDVTEQNMQARIRGLMLMAISNKKGALVLTTGNKSEVAVGYSTLYGDMAGGFNVLKDVFKTDVYRLARWRNLQSQVIPQSVIERPPSAELAPGQMDQDSLPDYDQLDQILAMYIEQDLSAEDIVDRGFASEVVYRVVKMVDRNEYKRRQAPVGPRISQRAFGRDRRYPITNGWQPGD